MTPPVLDTRAWGLILLLGAIWGVSFLAIKLALVELPVMTLVAHRVFWAALCLWAWVWLRGLARPKGALLWPALLVMGLLNNAVPFTLIAWGQQFIETGLTSIFNAATAIFGVLVAAAVFRDERLTPRRTIGTAVALAGVIVAIGLSALRGFDLRNLAQLATLAGAFSYACAAVWARAHLSSLSPEIAAAGMLSAASAMLIPIAIWIDGPPELPHLPQTYIAVGFVSTLGTAVAYLIYYRILRMAGSGNAMLVTLVIPPVSILAGAVVLGERLAASAFLGFGLIAAGLLILDGRVIMKIQDARRRIWG
ncbi:MAG: DMT family transporter [Pseudomonadota bacterium]